MPALPRENTYLAEAGWLLGLTKITPFVQWTNRDPADASRGSDNRTAVGAAYWWAGYHANVKGAYTLSAPAHAAHQREFTLQLQISYS